MMADCDTHCRRRDLVIVPQPHGERSSHVLKDPRSGRMYGLSPLAYQVLQLLDGATPLHELPGRIEVACGERRTSAEIERVVDRARSLGWLEGDRSADASTDWLPARLRGSNPLFVRFKAFDPTPLVARFDRVLFPLFTRAAAVLVVLAVAGATALVVENWQRFSNSYYVFAFFGSWPLAWIVLIAAAAWHELGHVTACRAFGGEVRHAGILIYLFRPAFFVNLNDSRLMPKRQRIAVLLAGVYFELVLVCGLVAAWAWTRPFSTTNQLLFVVANVLVARMVFNLCPLLRLDGYFVIADLVDVPNLRPRAFAYAIGWLPVIGRSFRSRRHASLRERTILLVYALAATAFLAFVIYQMFSILGWWLGSGVAFWIAVSVLAACLLVVGVLNLLRLRHSVSGGPREALRA
jgi:putative peptide zinc metalloprotease protein